MHMYKDSIATVTIYLKNINTITILIDNNGTVNDMLFLECILSLHHAKIH